MPGAASPKLIASSLSELWSPRIIAEVDDAYIKVEIDRYIKLIKQISLPQQ